MTTKTNFNCKTENLNLNNQIWGNTAMSSSIYPHCKAFDKYLLGDENEADEAQYFSQKEQETKKLAQLAISNPEDLSHEKIMSNLFGKGIIDPLSDEILDNLSCNKKLLNDIFQI